MSPWTSIRVWVPTVMKEVASRLASIRSGIVWATADCYRTNSSIDGRKSIIRDRLKRNTRHNTNQNQEEIEVYRSKSCSRSSRRTTPLRPRRLRSLLTFQLWSFLRDILHRRTSMRHGIRLIGTVHAALDASKTQWLATIWNERGLNGQQGRVEVVSTSKRPLQQRWRRMMSSLLTTRQVDSRCQWTCQTRSSSGETWRSLGPHHESRSILK